MEYNKLCPSNNPPPTLLVLNIPIVVYCRVYWEYLTLEAGGALLGGGEYSRNSLDEWGPLTCSADRMRHKICAELRVEVFKVPILGTGQLNRADDV